ncbi:hypothetical protein MTO96_036555 [Rhipicephalus appendiculatus]
MVEIDDRVQILTDHPRFVLECGSWGVIELWERWRVPCRVAGLRSQPLEHRNARGDLRGKRVAIGLYRLCSSAEDRTIAHLFGVGRSTVNVVWRQFSTAVIEQLESQWICMVQREDMADHVREFFAVTGFPQAVGALDGCHFPVSPPNKHATDYYNYKGW